MGTSMISYLYRLGLGSWWCQNVPITWLTKKYTKAFRPSINNVLQQRKSIKKGHDWKNKQKSRQWHLLHTGNIKNSECGYLLFFRRLYSFQLGVVFPWSNPIGQEGGVANRRQALTAHVLCLRAAGWILESDFWCGCEKCRMFNWCLVFTHRRIE